MDLSWIGELGRSLVWLLCSCFLQLMDMCYSVLKDLAILNLGDFSFIWQWWKGICVFLTFFILMRVIIQYFKAALDEELIERYDPLTAVKRIAIIAFIVMLLPLVMEGFSGLASTATNDIGKIVTGVDIDTKPSSVLLSVGYSDGNNSATKDLDYKNVDINEIDEETGKGDRTKPVNKGTAYEGKLNYNITWYWAYEMSDAGEDDVTAHDASDTALGNAAYAGLTGNADAAAAAQVKLTFAANAVQVD